MNPKCDRHPDMAMFFGEYESIPGNTRFQSWQCAVEGCRREYIPGRGYQGVAGDDGSHEPKLLTCKSCPGASLHVIGRTARGNVLWACDTCDYSETACT
jgi:hypothetical protein